MCELSGLAPAERFTWLLKRDSALKSRTHDEGLDCAGVLSRLEMRLNSGLGLAGVAGGGRGSGLEAVLAILQGRGRLRSGERWSR